MNGAKVCARLFPPLPYKDFEAGKQLGRNREQCGDVLFVEPRVLLGAISEQFKAQPLRGKRAAFNSPFGKTCGKHLSLPDGFTARRDDIIASAVRKGVARIPRTAHGLAQLFRRGGRSRGKTVRYVKFRTLPYVAAAGRQNRDRKRRKQGNQRKNGRAAEHTGNFFIHIVFYFR